MTGPAWLVEVNLDTTAGVLVLGSGDYSAVDPFLAGEVQLSWKREGGGQPDPVEASFTIVAPDPVAVDIGRRLSLIVDGGVDEVATFYGRVAEVIAEPVEYRATPTGATILGMSYGVKAVDYTVDLAEIQASFPAYDPAVTPTMRQPGTRLAQYIRDGVAGYELGGVFGGGDEMDGWVTLKAEDAGTGGVLERVNSILDQVGVELPADLPDDGEPIATALDRREARRLVFAPRVDASTLPGDLHYYDGDGFPSFWATDAPPATYASDTPADFPAVLTDGGSSGWGLVIDDASPIVVPAARVDYAARWRRDKFTHPNRATVTYTPEGSTDETVLTVDADDRGADDPVVNIPLSAPLLGALKPTYSVTYEYGPRRMALMYLPENDAGDRWGAEAFRFYPETWDQLTSGSQWFPRHADIDPTPATTPADPDTRATCYARPIVVSGIDPAHTPTGRGWYAGTLSSVTLTLAGVDDRPVVEFTLRRVLPIPAGAGALTPADLDPGILVSDLDPTFSVYDYRLARGA